MPHKLFSFHCKIKTESWRGRKKRGREGEEREGKREILRGIKSEVENKTKKKEKSINRSQAK